MQRWLKLTKYFPSFGWLPTVLTTENGDYPYIDESLLNKVSNEIRVIRTKTPSFGKMLKSLLGEKENLPYGSLQTTEKDPFLKKLLYQIRVQMVSPDARLLWNQSAFKVAEKTLRTGMYHAIITTGPPHSTHLIGLKLKNKYNVKWIADFRDPWSKIYYLENESRNAIVKQIDSYLEKKVLDKADAVVTVSDKFSSSLCSGNKKIIPNAFDPDDFTTKYYRKTTRFRIKFVGALTESRKHEVLNTLCWIDEYAKEKQIDNIEFTLIGAFESPPKNIKRKIPNLHFRNLKFIEHEKVIDECVSSEMLLLVINKAKNNEGILTYKLYEYIGSRTFIMGVGPQNSDVRNVLSEMKGGEIFDYHEKDEFICKFNDLYEKWQRGECIKNTSDISEFSLPSICSKYADLLESITLR